VLSDAMMAVWNFAKLVEILKELTNDTTW
jgi:hypothetical protein